jgi:hypothetical protein
MGVPFEEVILVDTSVRPEMGCFARFKTFDDGRYKINNWFYCRDVFHNILCRLSIFFFSHEKSEGKNIAEFIARIEDIVDVKPRSQFGPTQRKSIMWIKPSRWWLRYGMRRSLFTILLRAGCNYNAKKDNIKDVIAKEPYLRKTSYAVKRFLKGCTRYKGHAQGWFKQFCEKKMSHKEIDELLVEPQK